MALAGLTSWPGPSSVGRQPKLFASPDDRVLDIQSSIARSIDDDRGGGFGERAPRSLDSSPPGTLAHFPDPLFVLHLGSERPGLREFPIVMSIEPWRP
jgi:hypothetical protein